LNVICVQPAAPSSNFRRASGTDERGRRRPTVQVGLSLPAMIRSRRIGA
jgi:hypothetical protein